MKVEIWSDVMCPFCYLGKHRFEKALNQFGAKDEVVVEWKSYQLDPTLKERVSKEEYFAKKGFPPGQFKAMSDNLSAMAEAENIVIDNEKAVISNTYKAHLLIQLAKELGIQNEVEETFFKMYFSEGYDMNDEATIYEAASRLNIDNAVVGDLLKNESTKAAFEHDIYEAQQFGITGVPYFIFDRKYAVSGAQSTEHFLGALTQAHTEWKEKQPQLVNLTSDSGASCSIDGVCN